MIIDTGSAAFAEIQRVSKLVFGNQDRLVVAAAVAEAEPGALFGRDLAEQIGITDNRVGPHLRALEEAALLVRLPKVGSERRVYFERCDSAFWTLCTQFFGELDSRVKA
jgi:DNA-binding MarR family transcriptional regulator